VNINTTEEQLEHTGGCSYGVRIGDPELRVGDRVRATDEPRYGTVEELTDRVHVRWDSQLRAKPSIEDPDNIRLHARPHAAFNRG
jgi:hypothetical protein